MDHLEMLKNQAQKLKDKLTKTPLEQILSEATSNENWNTPTKLMQEIADATYGYTSCDVIMKFIWKRLDSDNREWRRILKTLNVIEYLTKNGAPRCVGEFRDAIFKIRSFSDFFLVDQGSDKGLSIRDKTKQLVDLLSNEKIIEEERENAKKIRERLAAAGGAQAMGSSVAYQGYGSDNYKAGGSSNNNNTQHGTTTNTAPNRNVESEYTTKYGVYDNGSTGGLDKYKSKDVGTPDKPAVVNKPIPQQQPTFNTQPAFSEFKQPFQEPVKKLSKPGESTWDVPQPKSQTISKPTAPIQQVTAQTANLSLIDFDDKPQPQTQPQPQQQTQPQVQAQDNSWAVFASAPQQPTPQVQNQQQFYAQPSAPIQPIQKTQQQTQQQNLLPMDIQFTTSQPTNQQQYQQQQRNNQQPDLLQMNFNTQQTQQVYQPQQQHQQQQQFTQPQQYQQQQQLYSQNQQYQMPQYNTQPQQQQYNQPQQQINKPVAKQQDDEFNEFQGPSKPAKEQAIFDMLDLVKEKEEIKKNQAPIPTMNYQPPVGGSLLTTQADLDGFKFGYQQQPQMNYNAFAQMNMGFNSNNQQQPYQQGAYR